MKTAGGVALLAALAAVVSAAAAAPPGNEELRDQLRRTETAFAKTMADRDHAAFASFLAEETVFMGRTILRGQAAVAAAWKHFYEGPRAPFSWKPERVEVLDSGALGMTSGPVYDENGQRSGTFNSVWRREPDGKWRIVFDIGCPPCEAPPTAAPTPSPR
jgi:ketosteroid isomerase-like protein